MLLGSIRSISWNSLYGDEEENQTSNDTNLGVPDDIPLLGFLAAWSDAQNKQPDNWRYASSLSIPPLAFPGFLPPPAQVANPRSVPSTSLAWWPKTPRLAAPFLGHYFPVNETNKEKTATHTGLPLPPHTFPTAPPCATCVLCDWERLESSGESRLMLYCQQQQANPGRQTHFVPSHINSTIHPLLLHWRATDRAS